MTFLFVLLLSALAFECQGMPSVGEKSPDDYYLNDDDYSSDDYNYAGDDDDFLGPDEQVVHTTPTFVSTDSSEMVNEGDTIKLPCFVDNLAGFALIWKKGKNIIAMDSNIMDKKNTRIRVETAENGNTLMISLAEPKDAGEYKCSISVIGEKPEITHSIRIRVAPQIRSNPESGSLTVYKGEAATLGCDILAGNPTPNIVWRRKERKMPSGEDEARGLSITFPTTSRHHSGFYTCSADNGAKVKANATITLDVQHEPEVETQQTFIHTAETDETEVICTVHASPKAQVVWYKNGVELSEKQALFKRLGNKHSITLIGNSEPIYGVYKCKATNKFGSDEATTEVSGKAAPANFKSDPVGTMDEIHHMEWVAESISPITAFKLQYKKQTDDYYRANTIDVNDDKDWTEVEITPKSNGDNFYSGKYTVKNLQPATLYLARVSSSNDYGFNRFSQPFQFATKGAAPVQQPWGPTAGGSVMISNSIALILSMALMSICYQRLPSQ